MIPLNYHHLYYFYTVARLGSIARATETLLLSQPTISAQIQDLEAFFKRKLFERRNRRLHLTEDGRLVFDYAESIFGLGRELEDALRDRPTAGRVAAQLGMAAGTPRAWGERLLASALDEFPGAKLTLRQGTGRAMAEELEQRRLDLVLSTDRLTAGSSEGLITKRVQSIPIVFAAAPRVARAVPRWPRDAGQVPILLPAGAAYREALNIFPPFEAAPEVALDVDDVEIAHQLARAARGVVPIDTATAASESGLAILGRVPGPGLPLYLTIRRRQRQNPVSDRLFHAFRLSVEGAVSRKRTLGLRAGSL